MDEFFSAILSILFGIFHIGNYVVIVAYSYAYQPAMDFWLGELNILAGILDYIGLLCDFEDKRIFWLIKGLLIIIELIKLVWVYNLNVPKFFVLRDVLSIAVLSISMFALPVEWKVILMFGSRCYQAFLIAMMEGYVKVRRNN